MTTAEVKKRRKRIAPYVPASAMSQFLDHIRYVKTPEKVTSGLLEDYNIPKGHAFALLSALKFLNLTEDNGVPTPAYKSLQTSGEEFKTNLQEVVRRAYADLFSVVDPARNGRDHLKNFFARNHSPATAERATALFLDLCGEAGIPVLDEKPTKLGAGETRTARASRVKSPVTEKRDKEENGGKTDKEIEEQRKPSEALSQDELKRLYLQKLIDQISAPDTAGKDAEAIKAESELRKGQWDRIERLLGFTKESQKGDKKEEGTR